MKIKIIALSIFIVIINGIVIITGFGNNTRNQLTYFQHTEGQLMNKKYYEQFNFPPCEGKVFNLKK